ncbi:MAG: IS200/IS605 family transposase [Candidatus Hodarchaeales archaeon]
MFNDVSNGFSTEEPPKFLIGYHLIFGVKSRNPLLRQYGAQLKALFHTIPLQSAFAIQAMGMGRDHVYLLVNSLPQLSPTQIVRRLKQESTRALWQDHPELRRKFWTKQMF